MHVNITMARLKWLVEATVNRVFRESSMTSIGTALNTILANQKVHSDKLAAIHAAVLAIESGGGSEEQLQLLREILKQMEIPGDPEAPLELVALRERAEAHVLKLERLRDAARAAADLHNPTN